jgi:phosphoserine aminotransferase
MSDRVWNFSAGPATMPLPVLEQARDELVALPGVGASVLEISHRSRAFEAIVDETEANLRDLLEIPPTHRVLFLQGGASLQFAMVPMNFLPRDGSADFVLTGTWSEKALDEAKLLGTPRVAATTIGPDKRYTRIPRQAELELDPKAAYVHITSNNTIFGTQWHAWPQVGSVPLVADMSSDFLWRPTDVARFGLIYAGAQKNLGPSGVTVVVIRKDFMARGRKDIPKILRYTTHAENNSLYNTPPTFAIYLMRNVLAWIEKEGGLVGMERRNNEKAELLYTALDRMSGFYRAPVEKAARSTMNIVFRLPTEELDDRFVAEAKKQRMVGLKGHRNAGGIRVSAYNAVSPENIRTLVSFMESFAKANG